MNAADADAGVDGSPALVADSRCGDRPGYLRPQTGHCYLVIEKPVSWYTARDQCKQRGSHLATPSGPGEQAFVASLPRDDATWIGLSRSGTPGFQWITGEPLMFSAWKSGSPSMRSEVSGLLAERSGAWFDAPPGEAHPALCERDGK